MFDLQSAKLAGSKLQGFTHFTAKKMPPKRGKSKKLISGKSKGGDDGSWKDLSEIGLSVNSTGGSAAVDPTVAAEPEVTWEDDTETEGGPSDGGPPDGDGGPPDGGQLDGGPPRQQPHDRQDHHHDPHGPTAFEGEIQDMLHDVGADTAMKSGTLGFVISILLGKLLESRSMSAMFT